MRRHQQRNRPLAFAAGALTGGSADTGSSPFVPRRTNCWSGLGALPSSSELRLPVGVARDCFSSLAMRAMAADGPPCMPPPICCPGPSRLERPLSWPFFFLKNDAMSACQNQKVPRDGGLQQGFVFVFEHDNSNAMLFGVAVVDDGRLRLKGDGCRSGGVDAQCSGGTLERGAKIARFVLSPA